MKTINEILNMKFRNEMPSDIDGEFWDDKFIQAAKEYAVEVARQALANAYGSCSNIKDLRVLESLITDEKNIPNMNLKYEGIATTILDRSEAYKTTEDIINEIGATDMGTKYNFSFNEVQKAMKRYALNIARRTQINCAKRAFFKVSSASGKLLSKGQIAWIDDAGNHYAISKESITNENNIPNLD